MELPLTSPVALCTACSKGFRLQVNGWIGSDAPQRQRLEQLYADTSNHD